MTGGEIAAAALAGKVVSHAGKEMAEESKSIRKELLDQAKQTPEFEKAARSYAKRVALRQEMLTSMYKPIAKMLGVANEYFEDGFEADMAEKLADVPEEHIVAPKASLAAPAMQQLGFSLDEAELKNMYLSLLATASDSRRHGSAHPSFVEVIKQLSSDEVVLLNDILSNGKRLLPVVAFYRLTAGEEGKTMLQKHVMPISNRGTTDQIEMPRLAAFVDNWIRLGLIEVDYTSYLTFETAYDWVAGRPELARLSVGLAEAESIDFDRGYIRSTDFGIAFAEAVGLTEVNNPPEQ